MLKLCYKDYLAGRWLWLSIAVLFILYIIQPMGQTMIIMTLAALSVYATLSVTLIYEDQGRTETLYASLPLQRRTIVRGRYLLAGLIIIGGAAVVFGSAALTLALFKTPAYEKALSPLLSVDGVASFLFAAVFLLSAFLPLYYRFGLGRGNIIYSGALFALLMAIAGLERFAFGTLRLIPPLFTAGFLKDPGRGIIDLVGSAREGLSPFLFCLLGLGLSAFLAVLSLRFSIRFYERKEL
jgi:hypothetical protein